MRILMLDPLDDFGGHARRNRFVSRTGVRQVGYEARSRSDSPGLFSPAAKGCSPTSASISNAPHELLRRRVAAPSWRAGPGACTSFPDGAGGRLVVRHGREGGGLDRAHAAIAEGAPNCCGC